jgi:dihydroorotate dehydrogenase (fumarate)
MSVDLSTTYLGRKLSSPLILSACPLTEQLDTLRRAVDAGAAAAVMPSLFEEQIEHDEMELARLQDYGAESFPEALSYFPELNDYNTGTSEYLRRLETAKSQLNIPIFGSLNGTSLGGWTRYARQMQDAGADGLELNIYLVASDPTVTAAEIEERCLDLVRQVRNDVSIPLAVKLGPYFTALANFASRLEEAGADGVVLFNRFLQPDIDLETLSVQPRLTLSTSQELRLPLRWVAMLRGHLRGSIGATGGAHSAADILKLLLAGADAVLMASALYQKGPDCLLGLLSEIRHWMEEREYLSVEQLKGSLSQRNSAEPEAYERANYMKALTSFTAELP